MLSRFLSKPSHLRLLKTLISSKPQLSSPSPNHLVAPLKFSRRFFSSDDNWNISNPNDPKMDPLFESGAGETGASFASGADEWNTAYQYEQWTIGGDDDKSTDVFDFGESDLAPTDGGESGFGSLQKVESKEDIARREEEARLLEKEEKELIPVLKGPNRAFGDLVAASGITDEMLDNLFLLKDFSGIQGLPPLHVIEDMRYEKTTKKSQWADVERQKQEEIAKARVKRVDEQGRSYGTGRRKCSVARVYVQPGDGKFTINDKQIDVYFPILDQRAALLRPFSETKTLGLWDVKCTVKGGGMSGQVGAIRLGISRALQNWEPGFRPALKAAGFMTRDPRVVERKKPGKAKARKSFQWVKR